MIDQKITENFKEVLQEIVNAYRAKNGWELSALTHEANSPWTQAVASRGFYSEIPNDLIKSYYTGLIS